MECDLSTTELRPVQKQCHSSCGWICSPLVIFDLTSSPFGFKMHGLSLLGGALAFWHALVLFALVLRGPRPVFAIVFLLAIVAFLSIPLPAMKDFQGGAQVGFLIGGFVALAISCFDTKTKKGGESS